MKRRRRVDWPYVASEVQPSPKILERSIRGELSTLLTACNELARLEDPDAMIRRTVEIARGEIGFERAGIFLLDRARGLMLGTWGTDKGGDIVDEHHIMYAVSDTDRAVFL